MNPHALSVDPSGGLWMVASSSRGWRSPHVIVRFEANRRGRLRPASFTLGRGALASDQAWSNREGLSFLVTDRGVALPAGATLGDLYPLHRRDLHRCF